MPRIRTIKPEFWSSGQVLECSKNARLLFVGLWNFCDDAGRHPYRLKQIKAQIFPADSDSEDEIADMLSELERNGLIQVYAIENERFLQITGWHHQRIDKPQEPRYPAPDQGSFQEHSKNDRGTFPPDRKGEDRKGERERACAPSAQKGLKTESRATRLPEQWEPPPKDWQMALRDLGNSEASRQLAMFRDHWAAQPGAKGRKVDWPATWRNWVRRAPAFQGNGRANGHDPPDRRLTAEDLTPEELEAARQRIASKTA